MGEITSHHKKNTLLIVLASGLELSATELMHEEETRERGFPLATLFMMP